jgi:DNA-binding beta-propeller fold protein YncE
MQMNKTDCSTRRWKLLPLLAAALFLPSCGKPADPAPKPQPPPPFEFVASWGDKGEGPGKFVQPTAFASDELGNIYFVDPGGGFVHKFEAKGTPLLSFEDSRVRHASGIAVDSGGAIYVADAERGNIFIFFPDGSFLRALHAAPQRHFPGPFAISVDAQGNLFVPDPAGSRIAKLDSRGRFTKSWAAIKNPAPDERPFEVATSEDGSVFVAYLNTGRIEKYSPSATLVTSWMAADNAAKQSRPVAAMAVGNGFIFTISAEPPEIQVWTLDGQLKLSASLVEHLGPTPITNPQIAITPHSELLVFDPSVPRVFLFRMHLVTLHQK